MLFGEFEILEELDLEFKKRHTYISPNTTIPADETISETMPLVRSSKSREMATLTHTFPMRREHSKKLPDFRIGNMVCA